MKSFKQYINEAPVTMTITFTKWEVDSSRFPDEETDVILVRAIVNDEVIGYADFYKDWGTVENIKVNPEWQRKGVATKIYNAIEKKYNMKLNPSELLEPDGLEFWKKRDPSNPNLRYKY